MGIIVRRGATIGCDKAGMADEPEGAKGQYQAEVRGDFKSHAS